jgi:hypothetical protein
LAQTRLKQAVHEAARGKAEGKLEPESVEILAGAASAGLTPVEFMLAIMRDENADTKSRAWAAETAAPFIHARPAPVSRPIVLNLPEIKTPTGVADAISALRAQPPRARLPLPKHIALSQSLRLSARQSRPAKFWSALNGWRKKKMPDDSRLPLGVFLLATGFIWASVIGLLPV